MSVGAAAHVFVADLETPEISDYDRHHLERVLRLRAGETVTASDGRGGLVPCVFGAGASLDPTGPLEREPLRSPSVGIGFALVKGERPEWIVQKLTECGVDRILPFVGARSVVQWDEAKAERNLTRLRRVALDAAMQSRQRWLPVVAPLATFGEVVDGASGVVTRADLDGAAPDLEVSTVLVGPEGGWSVEERETLPSSVTLGASVLRAETAAIAAGIVLTSIRSGIVLAAAARATRS